MPGTLLPHSLLSAYSMNHTGQSHQPIGPLLTHHWPVPTPLLKPTLLLLKCHLCLTEDSSELPIKCSSLGTLMWTNGGKFTATYLTEFAYLMQFSRLCFYMKLHLIHLWSMRPCWNERCRHCKDCTACMPTSPSTRHVSATCLVHFSPSASLQSFINSVLRNSDWPWHSKGRTSESNNRQTATQPSHARCDWPWFKPFLSAW